MRNMLVPEASARRLRHFYNQKLAAPLQRQIEPYMEHCRAIKNGSQYRSLLALV
jgi:hypothetical protein